jgi:NDP-sugar pyrophosphorylase family protein
MPVGEEPILEIIIRQLARSGFTHLTLAVNHQANILMAFFGDGAKWGVKIDYSLETQALSTMGPLKLIPDLPENFLVMNGDILTDIDYGVFYDEHVNERRLFTISAAERTQSIDYGVLETDRNFSLYGFREKPKNHYLVSMGIYCASRRILDWIPENKPFGFDNLVLQLLAEKQPIKIKPHTGYWLDIGRPDDYQKAADDWEVLKQAMSL